MSFPGYFVSWFPGFLVSWFPEVLVSGCRSFLFSCFLISQCQSWFPFCWSFRNCFFWCSLGVWFLDTLVWWFSSCLFVCLFVCFSCGFWVIVCFGFWFLFFLRAVDWLPGFPFLSVIFWLTAFVVYYRFGIHLQISATKWGGLGLQYRLPARIFLYKQEGLCPPFCIWNHFVADSFQIIIFIL